MPPPRNDISVEPFSAENFQRLLSGHDADQVRYLARYLSQLGTRTIVVEHHYIDRHFREEYDLYHSRLLVPPPTHCRRFHFFSRDLDSAGLSNQLEKALADKAAVEKDLSGVYLGFVVLRPLVHAPIGRSILRHLTNEPERDISATVRVTAHLAGLELIVRGTAFQQQDREVGACATVAVWMAMSVAARLDGSRAPSPAFIAKAAARTAGLEGRVLPSRGLTLGQVTDAIRACGFDPEVFRPTENVPVFVHQLHCYLRSGMPVVLVVAEDLHTTDAHAVTVVGYKFGPTRPELEYGLVPTRSRKIEKLYVHDDRLGPYARAELVPEYLPPDPAYPDDPAKPERPPTPGLLSVSIRQDDREEQEGLMRIRHAIVPVYPRLRLPAEELFAISSRYVDLIENAGAGYGAESETFFVRAGSYLDELCRLHATFQVQLPDTGLGRFLRDLTLPRWTCVNRWWSAEGAPLADFLLDSTDILHDVDRAVLAVVVFDDRLRPALTELASRWGVPCL